MIVNQRMFLNAQFWASIALLLLSSLLYGADNAEIADQSNPIKFTENKGQWDANALYRLRFNTGALFLEKDKFTYSFVNAEDWDRLYDAHHGQNQNGQENFIIRGHVFTVNFDHANPGVKVSGTDGFSFHENYFIGKDPAKWASNVQVYNTVNYKDLYDGIDLQISGKTRQLKYSFTVHPGADLQDIKMVFNDIEDIFIENGDLHYKTSVNELYEENLYAYQVVNGTKVEVPSQFTLNENEVSFSFPNGYDLSYPLVIDPVIVFATYTGSVADNFGFTATYDNQGNFYAGGIARAAGYPATPGAFQLTYAGGITIGNFDVGYNADISITKFNSVGNALIYSTYLGGNRNDQPHSLIVNDNDELHIYGRSSSSNFPVTSGAYDQAHDESLDIYTHDMIITKFNSTGTGLIASTYVGGSDEDAANGSPAPYFVGGLKVNYADDSRGEIILDGNGNIYVASCTRSSNFPVTGGAFQTTLGGSQDACIVKFNPNLTTLLWSTFLGGSGDDAGYSLVLDAQNQLYIAGGTNSSDFPVTTGALNTNYLGGSADGFLVRLNSSATTLLSGTFIGTSSMIKPILCS